MLKRPSVIAGFGGLMLAIAVIYGGISREEIRGEVGQLIPPVYTPRELSNALDGKGARIDEIISNNESRIALEAKLLKERNISLMGRDFSGDGVEVTFILGGLTLLGVAAWKGASVPETQSN